MIYLFSGEDFDKKIREYRAFLDSLKGYEEVFYFEEGNIDFIQMESMYSSSALFFGKYVVVLKGVLGDEEESSFFLKSLNKMNSSENLFVFLEEGLNKATLDLFKKTGAKINNFDHKNKKKPERFNSFVLANSFGRRDKLGVWIDFRRAMQKEVALEELSGILFWKAKDMILKKNFSKFSEKELKNFVCRISYLLPEAREGGKDEEAVFERFLLQLV